MKNQIDKVKDIADGMIGIGGIPSNEEFYAEFDMRVKAALGIAPVSGQVLLREIRSIMENCILSAIVNKGDKYFDLSIEENRQKYLNEKMEYLFGKTCRHL